MQFMPTEIRQDYFQNKFVIISPQRGKRPHEIQEKIIETKLDKCFFCPDFIDQKNIIYRFPHIRNWKVLAIGNIYAALNLEDPQAYGRQEVIIETPLHGKALGQLLPEQIALVLRTYQNRIQELLRVDSIHYVSCFKNEGIQAGASKQHAHSQIFASQLIPPAWKRHQQDLANYQKKHGICPYCAIIRKEINSERDIWKDRNIFALAPYASEYGYEAWLLPRRHFKSINDMSAAEISSLAQALKLVTAKLSRHHIPYNYYLHECDASDQGHFFIKIFPRVSVWAGVELSSGMIINSTAPEVAAGFYRK